MKKTAVILAFCTLLAVPVAAPSNTPSHPLSHIHPIDVDFNMSGKDIFNVTEIRMADNGITITNNSIKDEANNQVLKWNASGNEWVVKNADVDFNSNSILGVGGTYCGGNEFIAGDGNCKTPADVSSSDTLNATLEAGNLANQTIGMTGNNIDGVGNLTVDGIDGIKLNEGGIKWTPDKIRNYNQDQLMVFDRMNESVESGIIFKTNDTFNYWFYQDNQNTGDLNVYGSYVNNDVLRFKNGTGNIEVPEGNLDVTGNITMQGTGNLSIDSGDLDLNGGNIHDVGGTECSGSEFLAGDGSCKTPSDVSSSDTLNATLLAGNLANDTIYMSGNEVTGVISNSGGDAVNRSWVNDNFDNSTDDQNLSEVLSQGNEAGSNNINLSFNNLTDVSNVKDFFSNTCSGSNEVVKRVFANGSYVCDTIPEDTGVENLNATLESGNLANQSIRMAGNNLSGVGSVGVADHIRIGNSVTSVHDGDSVAIGKRAGVHGASGTAVGTEANSSFYPRSTALGEDAFANGYGAVALGFNATANASAGTIVLGHQAYSSGSAVDAVAIGENSRVAGSRAVAIGGGAVAPNDDEATFGNLSGGELDVNVTGNLTVHGEDLDLKQGDLENFFSNTCDGANEVVKRVFANGSYVCETVPEDDGVENLNATLEAGNEANQSIDMMNHDIDQVRTLNSGGEDFSIGANMNASFNEIQSVVSNSAGDAVNQSFVLNNNSIGTDDQNLQYSAPGSDPVSSYESQEIGIEVGDNITFRDYYEPDTNASTACSGSNTYLNGEGNCVTELNNSQSLNETLAVGNLANDTIYMTGNKVTGVRSNSAGDAVNQSFVLNNESIGTDDQDLTGVNGSKPSDGLSVDQGIQITNGDNAAIKDYYVADDQNLKEVLVSGNVANTTINMDTNDIQNIGSGYTNITTTGKIDAGADVDLSDNNLDDVNSIDGGTDAVDLNNNVDLNGNSVTTSSGEVCIGDDCA